MSQPLLLGQTLPACPSFGRKRPLGAFCRRCSDCCTNVKNGATGCRSAECGWLGTASVAPSSGRPVPLLVATSSSDFCEFFVFFDDGVAHVRQVRDLGQRVY